MQTKGLSREEAILIFKELMIELKNLPSDNIYLYLQRETDTFSQDYQIHLPNSIKYTDRIIVHKTANNHKLSVKEVDDKIIIYKPRN
jgi:hypothetical protein